MHVIIDKDIGHARRANAGRHIICVAIQHDVEAGARCDRNEEKIGGGFQLIDEPARIAISHIRQDRVGVRAEGNQLSIFLTDHRRNSQR